MELRLILMALICLCIAQLAFASSENYNFNSPQLQQRFISLTKELRCSTCQNQSIYESNAPIAQDLKQQIYSMLQSGNTDSNVKNYLTERYSEYILFSPQLRSGTWALWFGPFLMMLCGAWFFKRKVKD